MCFGFLTNLFTELTVHGYNIYAAETQIANGLLKCQFPFYSDAPSCHFSQKTFGT